MSHEPVAPRVRALLSEVLDLPAEDIGPSLTSASAPMWTSLTHLMLVSQLENEFGIFFSNQEIPELTSYERIVQAVVRHLSSAE